MPPIMAAHATKWSQSAISLAQEGHVLGVALHEAVSRVVLVALLERSVLGVVVETDHLMARVEQLLDQIAGDEAGRAGHQDLHERLPPAATGRQLHTSITVGRAGTDSVRYAAWGTPTNSTSASASTRSSGTSRGSFT